MKRNLSFLILAIFIASTTYAQRYVSPVFDSVSVTSDVYFGTNIRVNKDTQDLHMDIYAPHGDTMKNRPVLVLAHGGTFVAGDKTDEDIETLSKRLAQMGYVAVSYNYRIGVGAINPDEVIKAAYRALQDGKAAVRWVRDRADSLGIDPNQVVLGGSSAGALIAIHAVYLDKGYELPASIDTGAYHPENNPDGLDGLEGTTNFIDQPSRPNAIVNLCGAVLSTQLMELEDFDVPIVSLHGDSDATVPYGRGFVESFGFQIVQVEGSLIIDSFAKANDFVSELYTFKGAGHVPYYDADRNGDDTSAAYMDTTVSVVSQFLFNNVVQAQPTAIAIKAPAKVELTIYPNPTEDFALMEVPDQGPFEVEIYDISGKKLKHFTQNSSVVILRKDELGAGQKIVTVYTDRKVYFGKLTIF